MKLKKVKILGKNFYPKNIKSTPENIVTTGVEINKCTNNSKLIIENNIDTKIEYIEGFILIFQDGVYRAVAHAWNCTNGIHFDTSIEFFDKTTNLDIEHSKQYFPILTWSIDELPELTDGIQPFTEKFIPYIKEIEKSYPAK
jgi:hypothetical protein